MANQEHVDILKKGVKVWNKWRKENSDIRPDLSKADLFGAYLRGAYLRGADLSSAILSSAKLSRADLSKADLNGAYLRGANLRGAILSSAILSSAKLSRADLSKADLNGAILNGANLREADLREADLREADLNGTILNSAILNGAKLSSAKLSSAILSRADLSSVDLSGATLGNASIAHTTFGNNDLSHVKGLDTVVHLGPSYISIDTIYRSKGRIPEIFLRGCGLKDWEIEAVKLYQPELTTEQATDILYKVIELRTNPAIQFNSCFISYSSKNTYFAERLHTDLQNIGVRCWFASENLKIGDRFRQRIDEAIRIQDKLLLILSEDSIVSAWVEEEVESALERERRENRLVLFPIQIDDAIEQSSKAWAASLRRTRHIGDFTQWQTHSSYQKAFARLMRDLKAEESTEG